ncbi:MAG: hypothetical protein D6743_03940, partial [Calditrichaeota bacterium]
VFCVIPAKAGIYNVLILLDSCFRRNDKSWLFFDFLDSPQPFSSDAVAKRHGRPAVNDRIRSSSVEMVNLQTHVGATGEFSRAEVPGLDLAC